MFTLARLSLYGIVAFLFLVWLPLQSVSTIPTPPFAIPSISFP